MKPSIFLYLFNYSEAKPRKENKKPQHTRCIFLESNHAVKRVKSQYAKYSMKIIWSHSKKYHWCKPTCHSYSWEQITGESHWSILHLPPVIFTVTEQYKHLDSLLSASQQHTKDRIIGSWLMAMWYNSMAGFLEWHIHHLPHNGCFSLELFFHPRETSPL